MCAASCQSQFRNKWLKQCHLSVYWSSIHYRTCTTLPSGGRIGGSGSLQLLVEDEDAEAFADALQVGDVLRQLEDALGLFLETLVFQVAGQVRVLVRGGQFMQIQQRLIKADYSSALWLSEMNGPPGWPASPGAARARRQPAPCPIGRGPVHRRPWAGRVLRADFGIWSASGRVRSLPRPRARKTWPNLRAPRRHGRNAPPEHSKNKFRRPTSGGFYWILSYQRQVAVAGVQLQVDLLVDGSLAFLVEVLTTLAGHFVDFLTKTQIKLRNIVRWLLVHTGRWTETDPTLTPVGPFIIHRQTIAWSGHAARAVLCLFIVRRHHILNDSATCSILESSEWIIVHLDVLAEPANLRFNSVDHSTIYHIFIEYNSYKIVFNLCWITCNFVL